MPNETLICSIMLELVLLYSLKFNLTFGELSHITRMEFTAMKKVADCHWS